MKNCVRSIFVSLLLLVYGLATGSAVGLSRRIDPFSQPKGQKQISALSKSLFSHTEELKSSVSAPGYVMVPDLKKLVSTDLLTYVSEHVLYARDSRYLCFAKTLAVRLRKADLLFPSHFFW